MTKPVAIESWSQVFGITAVPFAASALCILFAFLLGLPSLAALLLAPGVFVTLGTFFCMALLKLLPHLRRARGFR